MGANSSGQWLIRSSENQISGPYSKQQLCRLIQDGKIRLNDEVCRSNTYWFYLHEREEVKEQLGIELPPRLYAQIGEDTKTETDTELGVELEPTDPGLQVEGTRVASKRNLTATLSESPSAAEIDEPPLPELSEPLEEICENTAVLSNRAFRDYRSGKKAPLVSRPKLAERKIPVEKPKIVHFITYLMMIGALVLLAVVIKLLHEQPGG